MATYRRNFTPAVPSPQPPAPSAFTLVEMLIAMAITLVMMAAVVTLFANVSNGVRNRRATIEMSNQLRGVRNTLQQDLQGATCPGLTWQRPESNHGYIEVIEGLYREGDASLLIDADPTNPDSGILPPNWPPTPINPEIDHTTSILPSSNLLPFKDPSWATDGAGLGDYDDVLMLTVRNEHKPFVGRTPTNVDDDNGFGDWGYETIESTLAEVVWFAIENPEAEANIEKFFGEPGMRTIYRRTLLIAPWVNPYKQVDRDRDGMVSTRDGTEFKVVPGLVRLLPSSEFKQDELDEVFAALIAFQDRYDLSVRVEWDPHIKHWKIVANTLSDLTKRENRFGHFGYFRKGNNPPQRVFPYAAASLGRDYEGNNVAAIVDPEVGGPGLPADIHANLSDMTCSTNPALDIRKVVRSYTVDNPGAGYVTRPFVHVDGDCLAPATAQAMLNDDGKIIRVVHGPVPLWGSRRGEDVMMSDVLAFDLRVYDPGAPLFATREIPGDDKSPLAVVLSPSDPGWRGMPPNGAGGAYLHAENMGPSRTGKIGTNGQWFPYAGQGAYVDLGYGYNEMFDPKRPELPFPTYDDDFTSSADPWFFVVGWLPDVLGNYLAPGFSVYDTWSFHYENNGVNEDADALIDEGTDGLDAGNSGGIDDVGERETAPPYDKALRGIQVIIRTYERDARSIRQLRVNQHFMLE